MNHLASIRVFLTSLLCFVSLLFSYPSVAANEDTHLADIGSIPAQIRFDIDNLSLANTQHMGIVGMSYLFELSPHLHMGPSAYGAMTGSQGGFFALGGETDFQYPLINHLEAGAGIFIGGAGGGGHNYLWGGGLMVRPHLDILYNWKNIKTGISLVNNRFPNQGQVDSTEIGLVFSVDQDFGYFDTSKSKNTSWAMFRDGFGFDRVIGVIGSYLPSQQVKKNDGSPSPNHMAYAGIRAEQKLNDTFYWGVEAAGAASGGSGGYAEVLGIFGAEQIIFSDLNLGVRGGLGLGGGGNVSVGGGLLVKGSGYLSYEISSNLKLGLETGFIDAPSGRFISSFISSNLIIDLDHPWLVTSPPSATEYELIAGASHVFGAQRVNHTKRDLDLLGIQLNRYLNENFYLTGLAASAYSGDASGFSVGLFGLGLRSDTIWGDLRLGTQMMLGAAGGGGVDSSGGAVINPSLFAELGLSKHLRLRTNVSQLISISGNLNTTCLDVALSFNYETLHR
jgi:hypothetical protein